MGNVILDMYKRRNDNNPIVIEYRKVRALLQEVVNDIFEKELDANYDIHFNALATKMNDTLNKYYKSLNIKELTYEGYESQQYVIKMLIYNYGYNAISTALHYAKRCKYRREDKIAMLNNVISSTCGIYKILSYDEETISVKVLNVITNEEITVKDESLIFTCNFKKNIFNQTLVARVIPVNNYYIFDGFISVVKEDKLIKMYKNKQIDNIELLILAKAFEGNK